MRQMLIALLLPAVVLLGAACATGGRQAMYRATVGPATPHDIMRHALRILDRHQYEVLRADTSASYLLIETRWRGRYPLSDEITDGVVEAMTRVLVQARSRNRAAAPGQDLRTVEITAENMVRMADSLDWTRGYMSPMFRSYVDVMVDELRTELITGVRVF